MIESQGTKVRSTLTCGRTSSGLPLQLWAKPGRAHFRTHDASVSSSALARAERRAGALSLEAITLPAARKIRFHRRRTAPMNPMPPPETSKTPVQIMMAKS
jgi:hypothetical protein